MLLAVGKGFIYIAARVARMIYVSVLFIVMYVVNIGHNVVISARVDDRARTVGRLGRTVHGLKHQIVLPRAGFAVVPRFVEWAPPNNGRMAVVALDGLEPLWQKVLNSVAIADV